MTRARICAVVTGKNQAEVDEAKKYVDLFELRIDMIGEGWEEIAGWLNKPWIACCRSKQEGGRWWGDEAKRIEILSRASKLGATVVDIELSAEGLNQAVEAIRGSSRCMLSYHDYEKTPPVAELEDIVLRQIAAGAELCKIITTAQSMDDNLALLGLIGKFRSRKMVAFAMGVQGSLSRVLCPLVGGSFTYGSMAPGKESAPGQMTAADLRKIYGMVDRF
jgi:3-dehydroquinate dehydratase I